MKYETLEEASKRYSYGGREGGHRTPFLEGVKWQMERSYTEQDMIEFAYNYTEERKNKGARALTPELLIKQFKKK